jgi:hypothetical protein
MVAFSSTLRVIARHSFMAVKGWHGIRLSVWISSLCAYYRKRLLFPKFGHEDLRCHSPPNSAAPTSQQGTPAGRRVGHAETRSRLTRSCRNQTITCHHRPCHASHHVETLHCLSDTCQPQCCVRQTHQEARMGSMSSRWRLQGGKRRENDARRLAHLV